MAGQASGAAKICVACGKDAAGLPRVKDSRGRYFHKECYEAAKRRAAARKAAATSAQPTATPRQGGAASGSGAAAASSATPPTAQSRKAKAAAPPDAIPPPSDLTSELLEDLPVLDYSAPPAALPVTPCPACGQAIASGAVICMSCGFNTKTGTIVATSVLKVPKAKPAKRGKSGSSGESIFEKPWFLGAGPAALLVVLFLIALGGGGMAIPFMGFYTLYSLAVGLAVLFTAFSDGALKGILCLCVPFYAVYYVFGVAESTKLKYAFGASLLGGVLYLVLGAIVGATSASTLGIQRGF